MKFRVLHTSGRQPPDVQNVRLEMAEGRTYFTIELSSLEELVELAKGEPLIISSRRVQYFFREVVSAYRRELDALPEIEIYDRYRE